MRSWCTSRLGRPFSPAGICALLLLCGAAAPAWAVPSFARQTGMACAACHTVFPELTPFGRMFKAAGYVLDNLKQVQAVNSRRQEMLELAKTPALSIMAQVSYTQLKTRLPDVSNPAAPGLTQKGTAGFPQQLSLFYAGKIAPHFGMFSQLTYENDAGTIGIDNTDLRFAWMTILPHKQTLLYGVSLNNNPTVQDLWNSTPAFGFPYASSNANVSPLAATEIDGTLGQDVAGLSAYAFWNQSLYVEAGVYRSAKQGQTDVLTGAAGPLDGSADNVIEGGAPYWRVAYEHDWGANSLEVGMYGAEFKLLPGSDLGTPLQGPDNRFNDVAEDVQYQYIGEDHIISVEGTRIHEKMSLDASYAAGAVANASDDLTTSRLWATYYYRRQVGGTLGWFSTTGSTDAGLYPGPAPDVPGVVTSANGSPDTKGVMGEVNYLPWLNVKLSLQYTHYTKFNGSGSNYDGLGRNASDNDTLYLLLWFAY
ncbi:MAG TPA: hypothetical protein VHE11_08615 [Steroidobacteraceae bacterium]|nr:hypothetical protein [Steroidobacteraceae bacterium]